MGLACLVGVILVVPVLGGAAGGQAKEAATTAAAALLLEASQACVISGPVAGLDPQQAADVNEVVAAAFAASKENQMVAEIAVMVAMTESDLHNLGPLPDNAGSLGLFQQRGWGDTGPGDEPAGGHRPVRGSAAGHAGMGADAAVAGGPGGATLRVRRREQLPGPLAGGGPDPGPGPGQRQPGGHLQPGRPRRRRWPPVRPRPSCRLHHPRRDRPRPRGGGRLGAWPAGQAVRVGGGRPGELRLLRAHPGGMGDRRQSPCCTTRSTSKAKGRRPTRAR